MITSQPRHVNNFDIYCIFRSFSPAKMMQNLTKNFQKICFLDRICLLIHTKLFKQWATTRKTRPIITVWVPVCVVIETHVTGTCDRDTCDRDICARDTLKFVGYDRFRLISLNLEL